MSSEPDINASIEKAKEKEREWNWREATRLYEQELQSESLADFCAAELWERLGFCYSRASRQAKDLEEFKKLRQQAVEAYKSAAEIFEKEGSLKSQGRSAQCNAIAEYLHSWLASDPSEKRKMLDKCRAFGNESLKAYENAGNELGYGQMCNDLLLCLLERLHIASDSSEMKNIAQEGMDCADKATAVLSKLGNKHELLRAYFTASLQSWYAHGCLQKREKLMHRSLDYSEKAMELSREVGDPYYAAMSNWTAAFSRLLFTEKVESALEYATEMLRQGTIVRDNYLKGVASYVLAFAINWMIQKEDNPEKRKHGHEKIVQHAEDAINCLKLVAQDFFIAEIYLFYTETYSSLAREVATTPKEKSFLLEKAVEIGRMGLEHATRSGSPDATGSTLHALSKALHFYSNLETGKDEKIRLLEEALTHRNEYVSIVKRAFSSNDWILGVGKNYEGLIKADLARIETDNVKKRDILESAISDTEDGTSRCGKWISSRPVPTLIAVVGRFEDWFGGILNELYLLTEDKEILSRAIKVYADASEKFKKVNSPSRVAEAYWKMARNQDLLGEHQESAKNFENGFAAYKVTAQKIPHFNNFYLDYATYMKAWSEIEKAKFAHNNEKYAIAMKHYEKTASLLKESKLWSYLSSNFLAWSLLEQAEDLSRKENGIESINPFKKAIELFREAKNALQARLDTIERTDEKDLAKRLIKASDTRGEYCHGRIAVEEAKILDGQGEHMASSEKYEFAAETFRKIAEIESEQTRKELTPLIYLCLAWQKMMVAEARASPIMYEEAAELFKQAKEHMLDQPTSLLALAHSSFCKALEAGTEFEITRDLTMYSTTKKHMEAASNYYLKAGFKTASEYAKASQRLFDAYVYMDKAKRETNPKKETKYYVMAEKVLQVSAESYTRAKHPEKTEQVQRLLEKVREERELAMSLSEILHAPTVASSTVSFVTLTPSEEMAVGLEKFEHAEVQIKLIQPKKEIRVGEDFDLEIQIVNVGKEAVLLTRLEDILPVGFQLVTKPDYCELEDSNLSMKGKRFDPLKSEEIRLVLKPSKKGTVEIAPRIVCVDDNGKRMSREPEPVNISVSEVVLPNRITTGYEDLDNLLFGGIPENYAVILTSPSCDERDMLVKKFLEAGMKENVVSFYLTVEAGGVRAKTEELPSNFYLFMCNPRADKIIKDLPNVFRLKGVENLSSIDIALTKALRGFETSIGGPRRACIEIVSDVLLQHHAVTTRRWLTGLIPELRSKGFTTLAVMNPLMHPQEQVHAILGLFDGEISIYEKESKQGLEKFLAVKKMYNQRYAKNELSLRIET